jgi:monofunctional biosynthetic peptidoglycan transglycosylase
MAKKPSNLRHFLRKIWRFTWRTGVALVAASVLWVVLYRWVPVPITALMLIRCVEQKSAGQEMRLRKDWVSLKHMAPALPIAMVVAEDQRFLVHHGFDFEMINRAIEYNKHAKRKRGASTISQQTAKNVFLWPRRSWLRKGLEVYFTMLIEFFWSKRRIMEVYLNVVETGQGIYGAEATARHFWGKAADRLSVEEAALIAAVLPKPRAWRIDRPGAYVRARQQMIAVQIPAFSWVPAYQMRPAVMPKAGHRAETAALTAPAVSAQGGAVADTSPVSGNAPGIIDTTGAGAEDGGEDE